MMKVFLVARKIFWQSEFSVHTQAKELLIVLDSVD